jgi:hypothetical protein
LVPSTALNFTKFVNKQLTPKRQGPDKPFWRPFYTLFNRPCPSENNMKTVNSCLLAVLLAITVACGYGSKNYNTAPGAVPAIAQLSPDNTDAGSAAFTMTVNGKNFASNANVNWNGVAQRTTFVTANQLMVAIPAAMLSNAGTIQVTVTNPASNNNGPYGMGGAVAQTSQPVTFTIN